MEYVEGAALSELAQLAEARGAPLAPGAVVRIVLDACAGLQVAHELEDEQGQPLGIVHRDVSPHNVLVGVDGLARLSDFGIAKETSKPGSTTTGSLKGKLAYMAPEYIGGNEIDARADVFALGVVLWETLAGKKLFRGSNDLETLQRVANAEVPSLAGVVPAVGKTFDDLLQVALARDPRDRFSSARAFGNALETEARAAGLLETHADVATIVRDLARETLDERREQIREITAKLDAARTGGTTEDGPLRGAVAKALLVVDAPPPPPEPPPAAAPAQDGIDATLGGSGITRPSAFDPSSVSLPRTSVTPALKWFGGAVLVGAAAAVVALTISGPPAKQGAPAGSVTASVAPAPLPSASVSTQTPAASASAPFASAAPSATAPPAAPQPRAPARPQPLPSPVETVAPNPYKR